MFVIDSLRGGIGDINGFFCGAINCGLRPNKEQGDLAFIRSEGDSYISAVFTKNRFKAAPIKHTLQYLKNSDSFKGNFILINAKNANAMTGQEGINDITDILSHLPEDIEVKNPIMSSTGVIGYRLPKDKILSGLKNLNFNSKNSEDLSKAILTTDKFEKSLRFKVTLQNGKSFEIAGVANGLAWNDKSFNGNNVMFYCDRCRYSRV